MEEKDNLNRPENWDILNENQNIECENILNENDIYRERDKKNSNVVLIICIISFCVLLIIFILLFLSIRINSKSSNNSEVFSTQSSDIVEKTDEEVIVNIQEFSEDGELTTENIANKLIPSIVGIISNYTSADDNLTEEQGSASGIIMSEDGYIITNAHAVISSDKKNLCQFVQVYLSDDRIFDAQIVGVDTITDIAVLKISATGLNPAIFGNSDEIQVGEKAIAIGNPVGLELAGSVTQGIISGISRQIEEESSIKYIQTDAPINPGNSGGALINKYGQVIGINTAKVQYYESIGFAIPINEAKIIIDDIIKNGIVSSRVKIGISYQIVSEKISDAMGIPKGMRVISVDETTDAFKKGLSKGDIITHIDNQRIDSTEQVNSIMSNKKLGDSVLLTVYRVVDGNSQEITLNVNLEIDTSGSIG